MRPCASRLHVTYMTLVWLSAQSSSVTLFGIRAQFTSQHYSTRNDHTLGAAEFCEPWRLNSGSWAETDVPGGREEAARAHIATFHQLVATESDSVSTEPGPHAPAS